MQNRSKTIEKMSKMMEKEAKAQLALESTKWNGYTILSISEWRKVLFGTSPPDAVQFLPDDYTPDNTILSIFVRGQELEKWKKNWIDYMIHRKSPAFGRRCCTGCMLNSDLGPIGRHAMRKYGDGCGVVNAFLCPSEHGAEHMVLVGKACKIIEQVLVYPAKQAMYDTMKTFLVDHLTGQAVCYDYPGDVRPTKDMMENHLGLFSGVVLNSADDYFTALSDEGLFSGLYDRYCDFVENGRKYYGKKFECKQEADEMRKIKDFVLSLIGELGIEHDVLEELHQSCVEFENKERDRFEEHKKAQLAMAPEIFGHIIGIQRNGACGLCGEFANVRCTSCSVWVCVKHWREH